MPDISIPPWLTQPLNEAEMYQRGMALGAQMGAQRAQQRMAELSAQRQAQEMAMQQAQFETTQSLRERAFEQEAQEAARRTMAQMRYKSLVESGVDPAKAMMQTPELFGNSLAGVAAMMRDQERQDAAENFKPRVESIGDYDVLYESPTQRRAFQRIKPPTVQSLDVDGRKIPFLYNENTGGIHTVPSPDNLQRLTPEDASRLRMLERDVSRAETAYQTMIKESGMDSTDAQRALADVNLARKAYDQFWERQNKGNKPLSPAPSLADPPKLDRDPLGIRGYKK